MAETEVQTPAVEQPAPPARRSRSEIAAELFGKEFVGEVKKEEQAPKQAEKPEAASEGGAEDVSEPTESEAETTAKPEEGEAEQTSEDSSETKTIETLAELTEHLQYDPEWVNNLKVAVKVNHQTSEVPLSDLVASYQMREAAEDYLKQARDAQTSATTEAAEKRQALEGQFRVVAELVKAAETTLERDIKAIDPQLRDTDPAEWSARIQEFNQRRGDIERMKLQTVEAYRQSMLTDTAEAQARENQFKAEQRKLLLEKLPELNDPKKAEEENVKTAEYLHRQGFTQDDFAKLLDHRHWLIVRKARLYDESRGQVDAAKKKVVTVPKIMKPGAPKPADQLASERLAKLHAKAKATGTVDDAIAYRMAKRGASKR